METNRQKKIGALLQNDLVSILQGEIRKNNINNLVISVSKVNVTSDLSIAKVHLSIFPTDKAAEILAAVKSNAPLIKHDLAQRVKNQLRKVPNLIFYIDDSLDYFTMLVTTPAPTVRPPSRIAKFRPCSIAIGASNLTLKVRVSPGITISLSAGSSTSPVTSVVRK